MSKLRERIRSTLERRSVPFGFGPRGRGAESQRHVLVLAEVGGAKAAARAAAAGADALLVGAEDIEAVIEAADGRPVGARVEAATSADTDALIEGGADFLVFDDAQTEAAALLRPDLGHVALLPDARGRRGRAAAAAAARPRRDPAPVVSRRGDGARPAAHAAYRRPHA